jgi:hypothetical protein
MYPGVHDFNLAKRLALWAVAALFATASWGQAVVSESELKAALVFNFARYVEWPERTFATPDAPLVMCLVGRDRIATAFVALDGRRLQGRAVRARVTPPEETRGCHVLFISEPSERQLAAILRGVAGQPVLTVSDAEGFIDAGGAIGIVPGEQRLQFEVNRAALGQAQLKASSQLLKLARAVVGVGG